MLSPQIAEFVRKTQMNNGFDLGELPKGTLLQIETQNDTFYILVLEPKEGKVALKVPDHPQLQEPQVFYHQGATGGGSTVKFGWVGVGLHLRMNPGGGGLMTTSPVKSFKVIQNEALAQELRTVGEKFDNEKTISPEEFDAAVKKTVAKCFPAKHHAEIQQFVDQFCSEGKGIMLGILDCAHKAGKLSEALQILKEDFKEHWGYRPKKFRGSFITEQDVHYANRPYQKLGIPLPPQG